MKCNLKWASFLLMSACLIASPAWAVDSLGALASHLSLGAALVTRVMLAVCLTVGVTLLIIGYTQYRMHMLNPKAVPLGIPFTYWVLGIALCGVPFFDYYLGETGSPLQYQHEKTDYLPKDIDAPLHH